MKLKEKKKTSTKGQMKKNTNKKIRIEMKNKTFEKL
jgi:hypothetical protein